MTEKEQQRSVSALDRMLASEPKGDTSIFEKLYDKKNLKMNTEVTSEFVVSAAIGYMVAEIISSPMKSKRALKIFLDYILELNISKNRKGREELTQISIAKLQSNESEEE